jgi:hypothetical protein
MTVKFYYDQLFKARFGANVAATLDSVSSFAQGFYLLPTLTTTIKFVATPHQEIPVSLTGADGASL